MKCTNRLAGTLSLILAASAALFAAGCGGSDVALENPCDVYGMSKAVGISEGAGGGAEAQPYFSEGLCVSEDVSIGADETDSWVAEGAGAFNLKEGSVVYAKNIYKRLYPASTTKILTAYLALRHCEDLDEKVTVSGNAANQEADSSVCDLREGDVLSMRCLLYGLMIRSGNDAAIAIAEHVAGDVSSFVDMMNEEARAIGATQSHFANPNGLPDEQHYTTVYDMYLIFAEALKDERFLDLIGKTEFHATYKNAAGEMVEQDWASTNLYMTGEEPVPDGFTILGGKTGTTGEAGYCLVLYSTNPGGDPIISIVFKADGRADLYLLMSEMLRGFC